MVYKYLEELQASAKELPVDLQQRCPQELLGALADSLMDGTVMEIIHGLQVRLSTNKAFLMTILFFSKGDTTDDRKRFISKQITDCSETSE